MLVFAYLATLWETTEGKFTKNFKIYLFFYETLFAGLLSEEADIRIPHCPSSKWRHSLQTVQHNHGIPGLRRQLKLSVNCDTVLLRQFLSRLGSRV